MIGEVEAVFEGKNKHSAATLKMIQNSLVIFVEDQAKLKFYRTIDQQFVDEQDKFFTSYFESPEDVFTYLTEHFSEVILEQGILRFSFVIGVKKSIREVRIILDPEGMERTTISNSQIPKLKEQKDENILNLVNQFRQYKKMSEERQKYDFEKITALQDCLQREQLHRKKLEEKLQDAEENVSQLQEEIKEISQKLEMKNDKQEEEIDKSPYQINHHPENAHQKMLSITNSNNSYFRIEKEFLDDNFYCNFVNKTEIILGQVAKYSINLVNVTDSYLLIGFCTEKGLGNKDNYNHAESVYYNCRKNGYLKTGGKTKELSDCGSRNGDLVECIADLKEETFFWRHTARGLVSCRVPEAMLGKPIYLSILLLYPGNNVDVKFIE